MKRGLILFCLVLIIIPLIFAQDNVTISFLKEGSFIGAQNNQTYIGIESPEDIYNVFLILFGILWGMIILFILALALGVYIYTSFAFMKIAEKLKIKNKEIAWIPIIGKPLIASKSAKMHWWPILLLIGVFIYPLMGVFAIVFSVFYYIWRWKMFEQVGRPGWWVLFNLIPIFGGIVYLILLGIATWEK